MTQGSNSNLQARETISQPWWIGRWLISTCQHRSCFLARNRVATGTYSDAETGVQYLRARSSAPATLQSLSADPRVDQTGQPYAYTAADPLNATDPTGLCDNVHRVSLFGHSVQVRYHVPFTSDRHM